jgi:hypothetical protein
MANHTTQAAPGGWPPRDGNPYSFVEAGAGAPQQDPLKKNPFRSLYEWTRTRMSRATPIGGACLGVLLLLGGTACSSGASATGANALAYGGTAHDGGAEISLTGSGMNAIYLGLFLTVSADRDGVYPARLRLIYTCSTELSGLVPLFRQATLSLAPP